MSQRPTRADIAGTWFGDGLSDTSLARLTDLARTYDEPGGSRLLHVGDKTQELSIVIAGRVALTEHVPGRGSVTFMTVEPGDVFGWSALVPPHMAVSTVSSVEPVTVLAFDGARLQIAMADDPSLGIAVQAKLLDALARRLQATRHQWLDVYGAGLVEPVFEPW